VLPLPKKRQTEEGKVRKKGACEKRGGREKANVAKVLRGKRGRRRVGATMLTKTCRVNGPSRRVRGKVRRKAWYLPRRHQEKNQKDFRRGFEQAVKKSYGEGGEQRVGRCRGQSPNRNSPDRKFPYERWKVPPMNLEGTRARDGVPFFMVILNEKSVKRSSK